jgi:hypothetical protein
MTADEKMQEMIQKLHQDPPAGPSTFSLTFNTALDKMLVDIMKDSTVGRIPAGFNKSFACFNATKDELRKLLQEKREFGAKKYGDRSFQNSFDNLVTCPVHNHLQEEIIDALNYSLTLQYISHLAWDMPQGEYYQQISEDLINIYGRLRQYEEK